MGEGGEAKEFPVMRSLDVGESRRRGVAGAAMAVAVAGAGGGSGGRRDPEDSLLTRRHLVG